MNIWKTWTGMSLVKRILIGLILGIILALTLGEHVVFVAIFGNLFVGALKAIAPILVFVLVMSAICRHQSGTKTNLKAFVALSFIGIFSAAILGVTASFMFPTKLELSGIDAIEVAAPSGITEVLHNILMNLVDNPIRALANGNYIGILTWSILLGIALQKTANDSTKEVISNLSDAVTKVVRIVINFAPVGIMGLVYSSIMESGLEVLLGYGRLIMILVSTMLVAALVINPLIVFLVMRKNPYPLVLTALRESGITAFFTRSSAANIPVNMALCEKLELDKDTYAVAIPLGATINMAGAAVTISILSMSAAYTLGISVDFPTAVILCALATLSATGASGVAGGSLLLIPLACSLFGIPDSISMQVVGVGFIIGVVQDSCETALNSHSDVVYLGSLEGRKQHHNHQRR
ncbi:MAG: serine/threonine transporter SstT [Bacteroidales bacterium]|jgi:serine/threonine transporter|nr:serine/threonine transporter SstT [Bacteroidales bacterium]